MALTAVIPTSIKIAASKANTIKGVSWSFLQVIATLSPSSNRLRYQWLAMRLAPPERIPDRTFADTNFLHLLYWYLSKIMLFNSQTFAWSATGGSAQASG